MSFIHYYLTHSDENSYRGTPLATINPDSRSTPSSSKILPSVTKVIKGQDGKTYIQNIADVEDNVLSEEKDDYLISDDEIDKEMKNIASTGIDISRMSISSTLLLRKPSRNVKT